MSLADQPFGAPLVAQSWERRARIRALLMAKATTRMLDAARIGPGSHVLDIGTGTGDTALLAAERVGSTGWVIAIDASAAMVEQALNNVRSAGATNVDVRLMDGGDLELDDATADAVVGRNSMQFLPGWPQPLQGIRRVLRPGGRLAFIVWAPKELNPYFQLPITVAQEHGWMRVPAPQLETPYRLADADRLAGDLASAGFRDVSVERVVGEVQMVDGGALVAYIRDSAMFRNNYDELDHADQEAFDSAMTESLERFRTGDGYRVQATSLLANATR
ncbi:MAG TPA: methyltransferase domain-containing protein [Candidatus Dormibacteraeota bacterium]|nr:methyltransferase domain-containing protein [Candidatus Dormibacteraeota bacterium]